MKKQLFLGLVATAVVSGASAVEITKEWKIVVPRHEAGVVRFGYEKASQALQKDLAEGAGLKLEIVKTPPKEGAAIYLGADAAKAAGVRTDDLVWFDNAIVEKDGNLYLFGNDRPRRIDSKPWEWFRAVLPTVGATVRFLHDYLGNRYCAPGETGRHVGHKDKVVVPDGTRSVERPSQVYGYEWRKDIIYSYGAGLFGMGLFHTYGGHTYPDAVPKELFKEHPEYFALRSGRRTVSASSRNTPLCISNPAVEELVIAELLKRYDAGVEVCQLAQNDGDVICECENCRKFYNTGDDWGEKLWCFHRHIAERIEKLRPGKIVHILCYGPTQPPPKTFTKFPSNVMIELCSYSEDTFEEWRKYEVPHGFTVYVYFWGNHTRPGFIGRHSFAYLAENAQRFHRNNVKGIYRCGYGDLFGLEGPAYYVFNALMKDPELPVDALVAEYCQAAFGPAAGLMQRFYDAQDERLRGLDLVQSTYSARCGNGLARYRRGLPKHNGDLHAWAYPPETVKTMEDLLARAETTPGLSDKEKRRLDLVRREFNYAKTMGEIGCLYSAYKWQPTQASFDALADALTRRRQAMFGLSDGKGGGIKLPGWPELVPLHGGGYGGGAYWLQWNGRLAGTMGAPITWDVDFMRSKGILPGVTMIETKVSRAEQSPTLDDLVSGAGVWARCPASTLQGLQGEEDVPVKTSFRLACDAANLYVGVKTDLSEKSVLREYGSDGSVWETETLDLYIAPAKSTDLNFHLLWTPLRDSRLDYARGHIADPLHPLYGQPDIGWNGTWRHEDRRVGNVWYSLLKIPYSDLGVTAAPTKGDAWRFNLGRIAFPAEAKGNNVTIWSPNLQNRSLDNPDAMGRIVFE